VVETTGRHDPLRRAFAHAIAKAMLALLLVDHALPPSRAECRRALSTPGLPRGAPAGAAARAIAARQPIRPGRSVRRSPRELLQSLAESMNRTGSRWGPRHFAATLGIALVAFLANTASVGCSCSTTPISLARKAGHPIFGLLLGDRITVYGGTLAQLLFPGLPRPRRSGGAARRCRSLCARCGCSRISGHRTVHGRRAAPSAAAGPAAASTTGPRSFPAGRTGP